MKLENIQATLNSTPAYNYQGKVLAVSGPIIKAQIPNTSIGDIVRIDQNNPVKLYGEVTSFSEHTVTISPFGSTNGVYPGASVFYESTASHFQAGAFLLGSIVNGLGQIQKHLVKPDTNIAKKLPDCTLSYKQAPPPPLSRHSIEKVFATGIKAIDSLCTLAQGQRMCIYAEPGIGKSTLMSSIAASSTADINVIALIGERGREVQEMCTEKLSSETLSRTVIVAATSDEPAMIRVHAAECATRIAEYFREQGFHVLLQLDSLTRLFRALREVGLASGEVPVRRGYPPSVFEQLPKLLERAGTSANGSITALYTVLLSSELDEDPMVEEVKGITDGHIILRRKIAEQGRYPAIDINASCSRLAAKIAPQELKKACSKIRAAISKYAEEKEFRMLGSSIDTNFSQLTKITLEIEQFLSQKSTEIYPFSDTVSEIVKLAEKLQ